MQLSIVRSACLEILEIWGICFLYASKAWLMCQQNSFSKKVKLLFLQKRDQLYCYTQYINIWYGTVYHLSFLPVYHSEVGRCENRSMKSMDLIIFFGEFWVHFIGIKLYQNHGFPMILGRICHNGLQHFMVNFSRKSPSRQANRCWFCQWGFFLGIHKFRCLTFNYDDNCGLGHDLRFPGKKWRGKKKISWSRFFRRFQVMAFPDFFLSSFSDSGTGPSRDRDEIVLLNNWTSGKGNLVG